MKLICIGDSLTFGYGVHLSQRWTRLCAQETGWELVNEGINGDTTGGMLARMQGGVLAELREGGLGAGRPYVLLMGGSNDVFYSGSDACGAGKYGRDDPPALFRGRAADGWHPTSGGCTACAAGVGGRGRF